MATFLASSASTADLGGNAGQVLEIRPGVFEIQLDPAADSFSFAGTSSTNSLLSSVKIGSDSDGNDALIFSDLVSVDGVLEHRTFIITPVSDPLGASSVLPIEDLGDLSGNGTFDAAVGLSGPGVFSFGDDNVSLNGTNTSDFVVGTGAADFVQASGGNDVVFGWAGADDLRGGKGNDLINGGDDNDTLKGGTGDDTVYGGSGDDIVDQRNDTGLVSLASGETTDAGNNFINGNAGNDIILDGFGDSTLGGGKDDDYVDGSAGDDEIRGGMGADTLIGGTGNDDLYGGSKANAEDAYADTFSFDANSDEGSDNIFGFTRGLDKIELTSAGGVQLSGADLVDAIADISGNDADPTLTVITLTSGTEITVNGQLDISDFAGFDGTEVSVLDAPAVDEDAGTATFTIELSAVSDSDVTVSYETNSESAGSGSGNDYTSTSGSVTILAGSTSATVDVPILDDLDSEDPETFSLEITSVENAVVADGSGTATINDDDDAPLVSDLEASLSIATGTATFLDADVSVSAGSAAGGFAGGQLEIDGDFGFQFALDESVVTRSTNDFVFVSGVVIGQFSSGSAAANVPGSPSASRTTSDIIIDLNENASPALIEALIESLQITGSNQSFYDETDEIEINLTNADGNMSQQTVEVTVLAGNTLPLAEITNLDGDNPFLEIGTAPETIDVGSAAGTNFLSAINGGAGGVSLTVEIVSGEAASDTLALSGVFSDVSGFLVANAGTSSAKVLGTVTGGSDAATPLIITFNDSAVQGDIEAVMQSIAFFASDVSVDGDRDITFTLADPNTGITADATATVTAASSLTSITADADTVASGDQPDDLIGSAGVDIFQTDTVGALQSNDTIDGGDGNDRILAELDNAPSALTAPTISNVETIQLNTSSNTGGMDFANVTAAPGGTRVVFDADASHNTALVNVGLGIDEIDASDISTSSASVNVSFTQGVDQAVDVIGSDGADTFTFGDTFDDDDVVDGGNSSGDALTGDLISGTLTPEVTNVEYITFTGVAGGVTSTIDASSISGDFITLTVGDDAAGTETDAVTITSVGADITHIDLSGLSDLTDTAEVTVAEAADLTITGSGGDDIFNFGTTLDANDSIGGSDGTDTLTATLDAGFIESLSNVDVEILDFTIDNAVGSVAGVDDVTLGLPARTENLILRGGDGGETVVVAPTGSSLVGVDASAFAGSVQFTTTQVSDLLFDGSAEDNTVNLGGTLTDADVLTGGVGSDTLIATLASGSTTEATITSFEDIQLTGPDNGMATFSALDIDAIDAMLTLTNNGTGGSGITLTNVGADITTIDAGAMDNATDSLNVTFVEAADVDVLGSAGNDVFTMGTTLSAGDAIFGGNDTVAGSDTVDALTADLIDGDAVGAEIRQVETITLNVDTADLTANAVTVDGTNITGFNGVSFVVAGGEDSDLATADAEDDSIVFSNLTADVTSIDATGAKVAVTAALNAAAATGTLTGGDAGDDLTGSDNGDTITGGGGEDTLSGAGGIDSIYGGNGADTINGGDGDDIIVGGDGGDNLTGGDGADTFVFNNVFDSGSTVGARDFITDFSTVEGDKISINFTDDGSTPDGSNSYDFADLQRSFSGGFTTYSLDTDNDNANLNDGAFQIVFDGDITLGGSDFLFL